MQPQTHLLGSALGIALFLAVVGRVLYVRHHTRRERFEAGREWAVDRLTEGRTCSQVFSLAVRDFKHTESPFFAGIRYELNQAFAADNYRPQPFDRKNPYGPNDAGPKELWNPDFNKPANPSKQ